MYEVSVTMSRQGHEPRTVGLSGPDDHTPEQKSDLLLQAAESVQRELGLPSSLAEVVASRGTFEALTELLDELGVGVPPNKARLGLVQRVRMLGDEVRQLRAGVGVPEAARREHERRVDELAADRDSARALASAHGTVINEVRRRLDLDPSVPDAELSRIVGELQEDVERARRAGADAAHTIREVREAVNATPSTHDSDLGSIVRAFRIGRGPLAPETLAEALVTAAHDQRIADGGRVGDALPVFQWGDMLGSAKSFWIGVAQRLTSAVRASHPADQPCLAATTLRAVLDGLGLPFGVVTLGGVDNAQQAAAEIARRAARAEQATRTEETLSVVLSALGISMVPGTPAAVEVVRVYAEQVKKNAAQLEGARLEVEEIGHVVAAADGGVPPTTYDDLQQRVRKLVQRVERFERVLIGLGLPPESWALEVPREQLFGTVDRIADNSDAWISAGPKLKSMLQAMRLPHDYHLRASEDELSSLVARVVEYSDRWLALTPDTVARAVHTAMGADSLVLAGEMVWVPWDALRPKTIERLMNIATTALHELAAWPRREDTDRQRWQQALNRVRLNAGLQMRTVEEIGDQPEFDQMTELIGELRLQAGSSSATPEQLAVALFDASREVARGRGTEPIPMIDNKPWDCAYEGRKNWWRAVATRTLGGVGVNVPTSLLPVHPEQLARAIHAAVWAVGSSPLVPRGTVITHEPWEKASPELNEWRTRVAEIALSELPQIARADAESEASFVAHMDAVTSELRQRIVILDRENEKLEAQRASALDSFREIAGTLGMSFGGADDMRALGETTATAVAQLNEEKLNEGTWRSMYRGMLRGVMDKLDLPDEVIDDPKAFGAAFSVELEKRSGVTMKVCAPKPEDWQLHLYRAGDMVGWVRHGRTLRVGEHEFEVSFVYTGPDPVRPDGELLLPSVTPEQLGRAWLETPAASGTELSWDDSPALHELYIDHARKVIERLTGESMMDSAARQRWVALARQGRKVSPLPGEAFTIGEDGKLKGFRASFLVPGKVKGFRGGVPELDRESLRAFLGGSVTQSDPDTVAISKLIESVTGGRVLREHDSAALLAQLRELGAHVRTLEAERGRHQELFARLSETVGVDGATDEFVVSSAISALEDFNVRLPALIEKNRALQTSVETTERRTRNAIAGMERRLAEALGDYFTPDASDDNWADMVLKVSDLVADREDVQELAVELGTWPSSSVHAMTASAKKLVEFQRAHRVCTGAGALQRELTSQLAEALGRGAEPPLGGTWGWGDLIHQVSNTADWQRKAATRADDLRRALRMPDHVSWDALVSQAAQANGAVGHLQRKLGLREQTYPGPLLKAVEELWIMADSETSKVIAELRGQFRIPRDQSSLMVPVKVAELFRARSDMVQDLARALGLSSDESWEDMIEIATGRTSRAAQPDADRLEVNALAAIRKTLGLHERLFPAGVVDAVHEADRCRRMMIELREVLELGAGTDMTFVVRAVKELKASWDVMEEHYPRVVEALGVTTDTVSDAAIPEAVGKALDAIAELKRANVFEPGERAGARRVKDAVLTLVEASGIDVESDEPDVAVQKAGDAAAILRSWPDVVRGVMAFEHVEVEQPDEVEPLLRHYAEVFYKADRRGSMTRAIERLLAAHRGGPVQDNLDTMYERLDKLINSLFEALREIGGPYGVKAVNYVDKQRFAEHVLMVARNHVAMSPSAMWASFAEQIAALFESWAKAGRDEEPMSKLVTVPGVGIKKDRQTLEFAADTVRAHSAALVSGGDVHPLVMALQDKTFWAPDSSVSSLELVPDADGDVVFRDDTQSDDGKALGLLILSAHELAPVGAALLMLNMHHVRAKATKRQEQSSAAAEAAEIAAGAEEVIAVGPIRVTPTVPQEWRYGPNAIDPDPGKRWHIGCGGEVLTFDGVDRCGDCGYEWEPDAELDRAIEAAEQQETAVAESAPERDAATDEPDQDTTS